MAFVASKSLVGPYLSSVLGHRRSQTHSLTIGLQKRTRWVVKTHPVLMRQGAEDPQNDGEEPAETLFMRELRRRGISPSSSQQTRTFQVDANAKEEIGPSFVSDFVDERSRLDQRERSMALNSEGLDGLIPRAQILLTLGASSFLPFWPLILLNLIIFSILYMYFGASFIHPGSGSVDIKTNYVDPYELLKTEALPPGLGSAHPPNNYPQ